MKIVYQLSTPTCPPCRILRQSINNYLLSNNDFEYKYVDLTTINFESFEFYLYSLSKLKGIKTVPILAIVENDEIIYLEKANSDSLKTILQLVREKDEY